MDASATILVKRLGLPATALDYPRGRKNFAGDCVFFLQRHFVDCVLTGTGFESSGHDYLNIVRIFEGGVRIGADRQYRASDLTRRDRIEPVGIG